MKTLHLYLTRQVLLSLVMTVAVFTFVMLLGNVLKEVMALLVGRQITLPLVLKAVGLLVPYVMAYVLPFGMLTAVLLVFGRFSADQELTAVRASGVSLLALVSPILILSLVLCGVCAAFNLWIAPQCRNEYKNLMSHLEAQTLAGLVTEDRFIEEIPGITLFVRKKDGNELQDVRLYVLETNRITTQIKAKEGTILINETDKSIAFQLRDAIVETRLEDEPELGDEFIGPREPERVSNWVAVKLGAYDYPPIDLAALMKRERKPKISEMTFNELIAERNRREEQGISSMPVRVQLHRQVSFSFACFAFTLVGIPLAIQAHRRETSIGVAIALGLVLVYYSFLILGDALETKEHLQPHLILWIPNLLFQSLGGFLLFRANRG